MNTEGSTSSPAWPAAAFSKFYIKISHTHTRVCAREFACTANTEMYILGHKHHMDISLKIIGMCIRQRQKELKRVAGQTFVWCPMVWPKGQAREKCRGKRHWKWMQYGTEVRWRQEERGVKKRRGWMLSKRRRDLFSSCCLVSSTVPWCFLSFCAVRLPLRYMQATFLLFLRA